MTWTSIVWGLLALIWALDALRLRRRARAFAVLAPSDEPVSPRHQFLCAPGVVLDEATRRAASAHARRERLDVVDLVPADVTTYRALLVAATVDPRRARADRFDRGRSAGFALLVDADVLDRARQGMEPPAGSGALFTWAARLKPYAPTSMDAAVAPSLSSRAIPDHAPVQGALLRALFAENVGAVLFLQALLVAAGLAGPLVAGAAGAVALGLYTVQPLLIFAATAWRPRDLALTVLRAPRDLLTALRVALTPAPEPDPVAERRPRYRALVAGGLDRFFEAHRPDCPLCGGRQLELELETGDLLQYKPGTFTLERCLSCRHVFQNPRLSLEGLEYYYGDFYDGLGEEGLEAIFGWSGEQYQARARMVDGICAPRRWLDVGTGHGHFCFAARDVWPQARFDGLDLSESIQEAQRRRWIDRGFRGLFPELAPELADRGERYDVVSMSHYLEHTREPREELAAAWQVLEPGGALLIEVPDPESRLRYLLGRFWIPWFQPQHQHLLSVANLERLFREEGFEPVRWHRGEAHQPVDFLLGAMLAMRAFRPLPDTPWHAPQPAHLRFAAAATFWAGVPLLVGAWIVDHLAAPLLRRAGWSNTYRVVARKVGS